jgi:hypothetical protein
MKKEQIDLLKLSKENLEWFKENYSKIKKKHDNEWVVIQNREIVATGNTYDQIAKRIAKEDKKSAIIEFIDSSQLAMFF